MIVLASSRKHGGRCVAGLGLDRDVLVRPVAAGGGGELFLDDCEIDGAWPELFAHVRFGHRGHDGRVHQPENLRIDGSPWRALQTLTGPRIQQLIEPHLHRGRTLLSNRGGAVPAHVAEAGMDASLALVEPETLEFELEEVEWGSGSRPRVLFSHDGTDYALALTDFEVRSELVRRPFGRYSLDDLGFDAHRVVLTVSLAEPHQDWHTKLVAAVLRFA
jgi:hypothetical protein